MNFKKIGLGLVLFGVVLGMGVGGGTKAETDGGEWVSIGPDGGSVSSLAIDPITPSTLYVVANDGIFKSMDSGGSWQAIDADFPCYYINAFAIDPLTPSTLYISTGASGIFKSTDSGGSWQAVNAGLTDSEIYAFAIDPLTPSTLYVGAASGVFKSTDGGGSWKAVNAGLTYGTVSSFAIDLLVPSTLYTGSFIGGIFKSTDSGGSWQAVDLGTLFAYIRTIYIDPLNSSTLYVGTSTGVFKYVGIPENAPPVITINESNSLELTVGENHTFKVTAADSEDGDISGSIVYGGSYDPETTIPGTYTKTFTVTDSGGLTATKTLQVIVKEKLVLPQCSDVIDNDGDGKIDMDDPGCKNTEDDNEGDEISTKFSVSDNFIILGYDLFSDVSQENAPGEIVNIVSHINGGGYEGGEILQHELNGTYFDGDYWWYVSLHNKSGKNNPRGWWPERLMKNNGKPKAVMSFSSDAVKWREPVVIDASNSYDFDYGELSYEWDIDGNGEYEGITSSSSIIYYWATKGKYSVGVRVRDQYGAYDDASNSITVNGWYSTPFGEYDYPDKISDFQFAKIKEITDQCHCGDAELTSGNASCKNYCESALFDSRDIDREKFLRKVLDTNSIYIEGAPKITVGAAIISQLSQRSLIKRHITQEFKVEYAQYWNSIFPSWDKVPEDMATTAIDKITEIYTIEKPHGVAPMLLMC